MFELGKRTKEIALASGLTLATLGMSACSLADTTEDTAPVTTPPSTQPETTTSTTMGAKPQVEYYPLETGKEDRSEVVKVITLDDGRTITCIESHILHPSQGGYYYYNESSTDYADQGPEYDTYQDCDIENLALQTTTTSIPR